MLKADSEAIVMTGMAKISLAILCKAGYLRPLLFHHPKMINYKSNTYLLFNGHKGDGDPKVELLGDNGEGDHENGKGDRIVGKGQRPVLKRDPLGKEEPDLFVSSISALGSTFPTNTINNKQFLPLNKLCRYEGKEQGNKML